MRQHEFEGRDKRVSKRDSQILFVNTNGIAFVVVVIIVAWTECVALT